MGRPQKKTAEYYPMYVKDGRTLTVLQHKYGLSGIGFFTNLLRILTDTPDHYLNLSTESDRLYLSSKIGCDEDEMAAYIETMVATGKLHGDLWKTEEVVYCPDLVDSLAWLYEKRKTQPMTADEIVLAVSDPDSTPIDGLSDVETTVTVVETPQRIGKDRIVKDRIEERSARRTVDPVLAAYRDGIEALGLPTIAWPDTGKQHRALKGICEQTHALAPDSRIPDPIDFARGILAVFRRKREEGKGWWKGASPEPVVIERRFGELVTGLGAEYDRATAWEDP